MTALPGDLPRKGRQFSVRGSSPCAFGCAEFCDGRIVRHLYLYHEQLCVVAVGEPGGPVDGPVGGFRAVGAYNHAPYGLAFQVIFHKCSNAVGKKIGSVLQDHLL